MRKKYKVVNGTSYSAETLPEVIEALERMSHYRTRCIFHFGDAKTGKAWGDTATGRIGHSTGTNRIPLVIYNERSMGGPALLDSCIVKIEAAAGKYLIWKHPKFKAAK